MPLFLKEVFSFVILYEIKADIQLQLLKIISFFFCNIHYTVLVIIETSYTIVDNEQLWR